MLISSHMNNASGLYTQCKPKLGLNCSTVYTVIPCAKPVDLADLTIANKNLVKVYPPKLLGQWIVLRLYVLLVLLNVVWGSDSSDSVVIVEPAAKLSDLPDAARMLQLLCSVGFVPLDPNHDLKITAYKPDAVLDSDLNSIPTPTLSSASPMANIPLYIVDYIDNDIVFVLRECSSLPRTEVDLNVLQTIAVVRGGGAQIICTTPDWNSCPINLRVVSRVVNMLDCKELHLHIELDRRIESYDPLPCSDPILLEAQNTIKHAVYNYACQINFSTSRQTRLVDLVNSGIVLLRPFICVVLEDNEFQDMHLIKELPLSDCYSIIFRDIPEWSSLDFNCLRTCLDKCVCITIILAQGILLNLAGLESAIKDYPKLCLKAPVCILAYLGMRNESTIEVHSIIGMNCSIESGQGLSKIPSQPHVLTRWLFAPLLEISIEDTIPCQSLHIYQLVYTIDNFAKFGVLVDDVRITYGSQRKDLHQSLSLLCRLGALRRVPTQVINRSIVCNGDQLSDPKWVLQDPIHINLLAIDHQTTAWLMSRKNPLPHNKPYHSYMPFCQNIRYTDICIDGGLDPLEESTNLCLVLLYKFRCINANTLTLVNIRKTIYRSGFNIEYFQQSSTVSNKWNLALNTLTLDNVDDEIIYWLFGNYFFVRETQVHIINQELKNLAITYILSLPTTQNIESLMVKAFKKLDEILYINQRGQFTDFTLFQYQKEIEQRDGSIGHLNLHKVIIQVGVVNCGLYGRFMIELLRLGIQLTSMPMNIYIESLYLHPGRCNYVALSDFTLYNISMRLLQSDGRIYLERNLALTQTQSSHLPRPPKRPVSSLVLQFNGAQLLTEVNLLTIIHWVSCWFGDLTTLTLTLVQVNERVLHAISSRDYLLVGLDRLTSIQIKRCRPIRPSFDLLSRPYHLGLAAETLNAKPGLTIIPSAVLARFVTRLTPLTEHILKPIYQQTSLYKIITDLNRQYPIISCQVCSKILYTPDTNPQSQPVSKKPRLDLDNNFSMMCYLKCGHSLCNACLRDLLPNIKCIICQEVEVADCVRYLMYVPKSAFVLNEACFPLSAGLYDWPNSITWGDDQLCLYVTYRQKTDLSHIITNEIPSNTFQEIYVVGDSIRSCNSLVAS
ncbi:hypothetical protein NEHOM01_1131 [Nematocida homosporus]|uniref:uncharacterized protein n=1 Tax=Nematocida homosporus TaxID=1912981 RepID=UPI00221F64D4|nr:uncharacterized protein NEHOM01_1131 [Nematocida homosporus]KAI5185881.1 hypothetical protein NEHOM01_1131 [Nematocida homosporus]